jgi:DNA-binding beta-propeller fold protein YncE
MREGDRAEGGPRLGPSSTLVAKGGTVAAAALRRGGAWALSGHKARLIAAAALFAALLLLALRAEAEPLGSITQLPSPAGCVTERGSGGLCADGRSVDDPVAVAASADGKSVYVVSASSDGVAALSRNPTTGVLTQAAGVAGCVTERGSGGTCKDGTALDDPTGIAISPDGKSVYVTSQGADGLAVFSRNTTTGELSQLPAGPGTNLTGCVTERGSGGDCADGRALEDTVSVAVSGDNKNVYVASRADDGIAVFSRNLTTGALTQLPTGVGTNLQGCITDRGSGGSCTNGRELEDPTAIASIGSNVYVTSGAADGISVLKRAANGALTQSLGLDGCITERGSGGTCTSGKALDDPISITATATAVYVGSDAADGVAVLRRNTTTGVLSQAVGPEGCITERGSGTDCIDGRAVAGPVGIAVPKDGKSAYVASRTADGLSAFSRNPTTGALTQLGGSAGCVTEKDFEDCADGDLIENPTGVVATGDNKGVVLAVDGPDGVSVFARKNAVFKGELSQLGGTAGCVSETGTGGACADGKGLSGAVGVAASADGKNVYVASPQSDAVAVFSRNTTTGQLTQLAGTAGCISETGSAGQCGDGKALDGAYSVAVSPDGKSVYIASGVSDAVAVFSRNTTNGVLTQLGGTAGCFSLTGSGGQCGLGRGLNNARAVTVSGDNKNVYAVGFLSDAIALFARNTTTGALTPLAGNARCISETGSGGACINGKALDAPHAIVVAPDGKSAYVASDASDAVAAFSRNLTSGALSQLGGTAGCISETGTAGQCTDGRALNEPRSVAVSADNKNVYAATRASSAIANLARNTTTGQLSQAPGTTGCISETGTGGTCSDGRFLSGAHGVAVFGSVNVYASADQADSVDAFARNATSGMLGQLPGRAGCISETGHGGACQDGRALLDPNGIAVSADGKNVYVASFFSSAVAVFSRAP